MQQLRENTSFWYASMWLKVTDAIAAQWRSYALEITAPYSSSCCRTFSLMCNVQQSSVAAYSRKNKMLNVFYLYVHTHTLLNKSTWEVQLSWMSHSECAGRSQTLLSHPVSHIIQAAGFSLSISCFHSLYLSICLFLFFLKSHKLVPLTEIFWVFLLWNAPEISSYFFY